MPYSGYTISPVHFVVHNVWHNAAHLGLQGGLTEFGSIKKIMGEASCEGFRAD